MNINIKINIYEPINNNIIILYYCYLLSFNIYNITILFNV
jgi:hypothetical protein